jgi:pullulanase/glycogen debranching enzyme
MATAAIERLRNRQVKNFLALELMSAGTPMILMGDESRHTQRGNNNAYCQDSELSWIDWGQLERHADIYRFARMLIAYRRRRDCASKGDRLTLNDLLNRARALAFPGGDVPALECTLRAPRDDQRVLGAARVRAAADSERSEVAALHRHGRRLAERHSPTRRSAVRRADLLPRASPFGRASRVQARAGDG